MVNMRTVYVENVTTSLDIQTKRLVGEVMNLLEGSLPETSATVDVNSLNMKE